jgi:hypothetical protein
MKQREVTLRSRVPWASRFASVASVYVTRRGLQFSAEHLDALLRIIGASGAASLSLCVSFASSVSRPSLCCFCVSRVLLAFLVLLLMVTLHP